MRFALVQAMGIAGAALIAATTNEPTRDDGARSAGRAARPLRRQPTGATSFSRSTTSCAGCSATRWSPTSCTRCVDDAATAHIDTPDKLFEYFLMDVQMEPCMQTSRIRHALSSVQLFIERCLMNLEPRVSPASHQREAVGVDEALPGLGGEPQGLPLAGELAGAGAARRQVAVLQGARERAAAERHHRGRRGRSRC